MHNTNVDSKVGTNFSMCFLPFLGFHDEILKWLLQNFLYKILNKIQAKQLFWAKVLQFLLPAGQMYKHESLFNKLFTVGGA